MGAKQSKNSPLHKRNRSRDESLCTTRKTGSRGSRSRTNTMDSVPPTTWIHEGVEISDCYELFEVVAYSLLGKVQVCSRKRRQQSNHNGELVVDGFVDTNSETSNSQHHKKTNHRLYACKAISISRIHDTEQLLQQVTALRDLEHPSVLHFREVFHTKRRVWLVSELCTGGDLFARMDTNTELDVCDILEQLVQAVSYLHLKGTCHRKIQMENVLYEHAGLNAGIKLCDFGLSDSYGRAVLTREVCGVPYAMAPETVSSPKADVWSIGVVAYILLSGGSYPFGTDSVLEVDRWKASEYVFGPEWEARKISDIAKVFCSSCLKRQPDDRWTAEDASEFIRDKWMPTLEAEQMSESSDYPVSLCSSLRGMKDFGLYGELKKRILMTMADTMDKKTLMQLQEMCMKLDCARTGWLTIRELEQAIELLRQEQGEESDLTDEDVKEMFKYNDQDRTGPIQYVELLDAVLETQGMMTEELLGEAFDRADRQGTGFLSKEDMKRILGQKCDEEVVDRFMDEADVEKSGFVNYDEFLRIIFKDPAKAMDYVDRVVDPL